MKLLDRLSRHFPSLSNPNLDCTDYEVRVRPGRGRPVLLVARKVIVQVAYTPIYFAVVLPVALAGAWFWFRRLTNAERALVSEYATKFWYFPSLCIHKSIEGSFFRTFEVESPSCEIGCEDGAMTKLHFPGATFDVGVEFIAENRPTAGVHREVVVAGLPHLPPEWTSRFHTIAVVHVIDHVRDLDAELRDLRRIASPGARVCISALADGYPRHVRSVSLGLMDEEWLESRKGLHHFLTLDEWNRRLVSAGFRVRRVAGFLGGWRGRLWVAIHTLFEINGSNDLFYAADRLGVLPRWLRAGICVPFAACITSVFLHAPAAPSPCHVFADLEASP